MATQVGVGEVPIVPTIKGFRRTVSTEVDGATKQARGVFEKGFAAAGTKAGADSGKGFNQSFSGQTKDTLKRLTASMTRDVAKAAREVSQARLREQDAAGKVRLAETQLAEARQKYATGSSQVVRAEERLQSAQRLLADRQNSTRESTGRLKDAQSKLASETERLEQELEQAGDAADATSGDLRQLENAADSAGNELGDAGSSGAQRFSSGLSSGIRGAGGLILGAIAGLGIANMIGNVVRDGVSLAVNYVRDSISAASDLQQSMGAVEAIFKDSAATIKNWSKDSAQSVGLSQVKYQEFATVVGAQLKNMGLPMGQVVDQTGSLIGLGADLAAQFGGPTTGAVEALSSALRGERDPIERYGVSIKQADVNARLAAKGLSGLEGEALKAAEANATLEMIYEQTADAAGTFGREQDTLAGQQQRLTAEWENAQAKLGESLLPALTQLATIANEELVPILNQVIEEVGPQLGDAFAQAAPAIADMMVELAPLIPELAELAVEVLPPLAEILTTIAPLLVDLAEGFGFGTVASGGFLKVIKGEKSIKQLGFDMFNSNSKLTTFNASLAGAAVFMPGYFSKIGSGAKSMASSVTSGILSAINWIRSLPVKAQEALGNLGDLLRPAGQALIGGFIGGIRDMINRVGDAASSVVSWARSFFPSSPAKRGPLSGAGWAKLRQSGATFVDQWAGGAEDRADSFTLPDLLQDAMGVVGAVAPIGVTVGGASAGPGRSGAGLVQNFYAQQFDEAALARKAAREAKSVFSASGVSV